MLAPVAKSSKPPVKHPVERWNIKRCDRNAERNHPEAEDWQESEKACKDKEQPDNEPQPWRNASLAAPEPTIGDDHQGAANARPIDFSGGQRRLDHHGRIVRVHVPPQMHSLWQRRVDGCEPIRAVLMQFALDAPVMYQLMKMRDDFTERHHRAHEVKFALEKHWNQLDRFTRLNAMLFDCDHAVGVMIDQ